MDFLFTNLNKEETKKITEEDVKKAKKAYENYSIEGEEELKKLIDINNDGMPELVVLETRPYIYSYIDGKVRELIGGYYDMEIYQSKSMIYLNEISSSMKVTLYVVFDGRKLETLAKESSGESMSIYQCNYKDVWIKGREVSVKQYTNYIKELTKNTKKVRMERPY
ncbi:hypothetical protein P261_00342 [Lachnospiraceae bacterium TWA4]|nr:hypothetical protein P261_00342 [Lachnospiraceae bacterium TWA4]